MNTTKTLIGAVAIATLWGGTAFAQCSGAGQEAPGGYFFNYGGVDGTGQTEHTDYQGASFRYFWNGSGYDYGFGHIYDRSTDNVYGAYGASENWIEWTGEGDCVTAVGASNGIGVATTGNITINDLGQAIYNLPTTSVYGPDSTALGNGATVGERGPGPDGIWDTDDDVINPVADGTAIGARANVQHDHSTAIGADAVSTNDHQVTLGTSEDTVKAEGITSQLSKDRQSGPLEIVTSDGQGNLATDGGATHAAIDANSLAIGDNSAAIDANGLRIDENSAGVAMALAMDVPDVDIDKTFGLAASWGNFEGENAFAAAAAWRINPTWSVNAGIGVGVNTHTVGGRAGIRGQW